MEESFWHERWSRGEIGFHQHDYNAHMKAFLHRLEVPENGHILVPLCGKSRDMLWLLNQGLRVTGVEINRQAVVDFFSESGLQATVSRCGDAECFSHGNLQIVRGDFFSAPSLGLEQADAVYDRASLVALPEGMREDYVQVLMHLLPRGRRSLLITLDYAQPEMSGPPFSVAPREVEQLFERHCSIEEIHSEDCLAREPRFRKKGLSRLQERVYMLQRT